MTTSCISNLISFFARFFVLSVDLIFDLGGPLVSKSCSNDFYELSACINSAYDHPKLRLTFPCVVSDETSPALPWPHGLACSS
jgi:hypothetical protein